MNCAGPRPLLPILVISSIYLRTALFNKTYVWPRPTQTYFSVRQQSMSLSGRSLPVLCNIFGISSSLLEALSQNALPCGPSKWLCELQLPAHFLGVTSPRRIRERPLVQTPLPTRCLPQRMVMLFSPTLILSAVLISFRVWGSTHRPTLQGTTSIWGNYWETWV